VGAEDDQVGTDFGGGGRYFVRRPPAPDDRVGLTVGLAGLRHDRFRIRLTFAATRRVISSLFGDRWRVYLAPKPPGWRDPHRCGVRCDVAPVGCDENIIVHTAPYGDDCLGFDVVQHVEQVRMSIANSIYRFGVSNRTANPVNGHRAPSCTVLWALGSIRTSS